MTVPLPVIEQSVATAEGRIHVTSRDGRGVHVVSMTPADVRWLIGKLSEELARFERVAPGTRRTAPAPAVTNADEEPARRRAGR